MTKADQLKQEILDKVAEYYQYAFNQAPKQNRISYAGRVFDEREMLNLVDASLEFWLTEGRYAQAFEKKFSGFLNVKYTALVNSGSSANLLAFATLTSPLLKDRQVLPKDEIITIAAGFPTTVTPIIQYGATPVFVDVVLADGTYNVDCAQLEQALSNKTKAVMLAHTLGNPFDLSKVLGFCQKNNLWLIEDNCDALGSKYNGKYTGTFGDIATSSFYPPHHITMGEGGAVYTNNPLLNKIMRSMRDWGRDCYCHSGKDNSCGKRFGQQHGELPYGYDHKYVYSHFGYNLKATDLQAAIGCAQLEKLDGFIKRRRESWQYLRDALSMFDKYFILPNATQKSEPSWFGFLMTVKENVGFSRADMVTHLEEHNIQTRMLFAGNLIRHPCFDQLRAKGVDYRVIGNLKNTDDIMNNTFWIGVYPGLGKAQLDYMIQTISQFIQSIQ